MRSIETTELDESQKRDPVVGALLLGHKSSHRRGRQLTAAAGVKRWRAVRRAKVLVTGDLSLSSSLGPGR
jgi:hypothetical protein